MRSDRLVPLVLGLLLPLLPVPAASQDANPRFSVPVACDPGTACLVQQYPDMAAGPDVADPFCGRASYDGHDGVDIRVPSLKDMAAGVPVVAMADGRVLRGRDGEGDRLAATAADRAAVASRECGNGLVVDHGNGWSVQYCHLRQSSLGVRPGQLVKRGERLGLVGASGLAEFPHVHVTVRKDNVALDPMTGRRVGAGCTATPAPTDALWSADAEAWLAVGRRSIIAAGVTGRSFDYASLVRDGPPPPARAGEPETLGWGWFANLRPGDRIRIRIEAPDGRVLIDNTSEALPSPKAVYSQVAGRRSAVAPGRYRWTVELLRDGAVRESRADVLTAE